MFTSHLRRSSPSRYTVALAVGDDSQPLCDAYSWSGHSCPSLHRARKPFPSWRRPQRPFPPVGRALTGRPTRRTGRRLVSFPERQHPQRRHRNVRKQGQRRPQHTRHYSRQQCLVNRDQVDGRQRSRFRPPPHHDNHQVRSTGGLGVPTHLAPQESGKATWMHIIIQTGQSNIL